MVSIWWPRKKSFWILRAVEMGIISDTFKERIAELEDEKRDLVGLVEFEKATTIKINKYEKYNKAP